MDKILAQLRAMNLSYHHAHNKTTGSTFFADHAAFNDFYNELDSDYDSVAERSIGLGRPFSLKAVISAASAQLHDGVLESGDAQTYFKLGLLMEQELIKRLNPEIAAGSEGTKQLLGDIADRAEQRIYKIKQRLKG